MVLLGLWAPAQTVSGFGLIGLSLHTHHAALSEQGDVVLHHHDIGAPAQPIDDHSHDHGAPVEHHNSDDADDHVVVSAEPVRSSSSEQGLVRVLGSSPAFVSPWMAVASCSTGSLRELRRPPPTHPLATFQRNAVRLL